MSNTTNSAAPDAVHLAVASHYNVDYLLTWKWEECGCDFDKLVERLIRSQEQHPELLVREVPKSDPESLPA